MDNMRDKLKALGLRNTGEFRHHSGAESDVFWDVGKLFDYPEWMRVDALGSFIWQIGLLHPTCIVGIRTGGYQLAGDIANCLEIPSLPSDTSVEPRGCVVIVDDVLTTGQSCKEVLRCFNDVVSIAVLINRSRLDEICGIPIISGCWADIEEAMR